MVKRFSRLFVVVHIISDVITAAVAFLLAYVIRFQTGLIEMPKGRPPLDQYLAVLPFVALMVPVAFHLQRLYRLRRGRSRTDDFFAVLVGSLLTVLLALVGTLYVQTYHLSDARKAQGYLEVSQWVWVLFLALNVCFALASREVVRALLRRRWRKGISLRRVLVVGASDLGRLVADRILEHGDLGFRLVGFVDDRVTTTDAIGYRGLPILGALSETIDICVREHIDEIYVALPLDEHVKMLNVVEMASRECIEVHVVPDLLQLIALRAKLEDLDGLPIISINDMPLRGFNSLLKRAVDIVVSATVLLVGALPALVLAIIIKRSSPGPVFYTQERMGLDGKSFTVWKFRSMPIDAEEVTGPIWARDNDPRATAVGRWLRKTDVDELPQFWNVLRGDMSIVGPRPERPFFVEQFKHQIPQYMLRHKVRAGITGWAQVNGWRGNTSLEKRIEFDLYYIENWSISLDIKIMWLTVMRGIHRAAY